MAALAMCQSENVAGAPEDRNGPGEGWGGGGNQMPDFGSGPGNCGATPTQPSKTLPHSLGCQGPSRELAALPGGRRSHGSDWGPGYPGRDPLQGGGSASRLLLL